MSEALLAFDFFLRAATIGVSLLVVLALLSRAPRPRGAWAICALAATHAGYLMLSAPGEIQGPAAVEMLLTGLAVSVPLALSWAVHEMLAPQSEWRRSALVVAVATIPAALLGDDLPVMELLRGGLLLVLYVGLVFVTCAADRDDLVPGRRLMRRVCLAMMGILGVIITLVEVSGIDSVLPVWAFPLQSGALFMLAVAFGLYALSPQSDLWPQRPAPERSPDPQAKRVKALMEAGIWRREGLTIADMARELDLPEHRLRRIINQDLDQRNFSTFVNTARIDAACAALADPAQARRTVLEIAYDTGFSSLGPFNRAFRTQTGLTPTGFRAKKQADFS